MIFLSKKEIRILCSSLKLFMHFNKKNFVIGEEEKQKLQEVELLFKKLIKYRDEVLK